jgi:hypothetical protein
MCGFAGGASMAISNEPALEDLFPRLASSHYEITSPSTRDYNCVAWAAGYDDVPWDHALVPYTYWPHRVPRDGSVDSLAILFAGLGYVRCVDGSFEAGYEKVALYARADHDWTHVARGGRPAGYRWAEPCTGRGA